VDEATTNSPRGPAGPIVDNEEDHQVYEEINHDFLVAISVPGALVYQ
jgi:hypothetical protein